MKYDEFKIWMSYEFGMKKATEKALKFRAGNRTEMKNFYSRKLKPKTRQ